ncbi:hypothetical protein H4R99_008254, partial [Coemansia sp. RSA 1722]
MQGASRCIRRATSFFSTAGIRRTGQTTTASASLSAQSAGAVPVRQLQTASAATAHEVVHEDEKALRDVFDLPTKTTLGSRWYHQGQPTGLLMESRFVSPKSFKDAGKQAVVEAQQLVEKVLSAQTIEAKQQVVKCLDQLSDALCR